MNIAATVILYYPGDDCIVNIKSYLDKIEKLYIVDNTEEPSIQFTNAVHELKNIVYLHDGENRGIAARLNQVSNLAITDGFGWLLTMDQDSIFQNKMLTDYLHCITSYQEKEKVSMFGICFSEKEYKKGNCNPVQKNNLITSGSVLNLQLFNMTGGFDENLFIDEVDFEYCLRSISNGFQIIQFDNIFLTHHLGEAFEHKSLKTGKRTSRVLHSPFRIYYMTRNFLYVQSKYKNLFSAEIESRKNLLLNRIKNNILYNKQRFKVIKCILKGVLDFKRGRRGKL